MAQGILGKADLAAGLGTYSLLATIAQAVETVNVRFCNTNSSPVKVRLAIGTGGAPAAGDWMQYEAVIPANGTLDDTGIATSNGEKIWASSDTANVSACARGL